MKKRTTNWNMQKEELNNLNIATIDGVPKNILNYLKNNCEEKLTNETLAGQIQKEHNYSNWPTYVENFIIDQVQHPVIQKQTSTISMLSSDKPFYLKSLWVNFQKKYEFNPMHTHAGIYSFIIFLQVPYNLNDEDKVFPKTSNENPATSRLAFVVSDFMGSPMENLVHVDKSFEGKMLMFPAKLNHLVYPFYTSDEYRITVSGNISFWVE